MNQFFLQRGVSKELQPFDHIIEFAIKRNSTVQLNSFTEPPVKSIRIFYVLEGKFEWSIDSKNYILYPGDLALIQAGNQFGGQKGILDIGKLCWIYIKVNKQSTDERLIFGKWSNLPTAEIQAIGKILQLCSTPVLSQVKEVGAILHKIQLEFSNQQIGYHTRTNHLIVELFILIARKLTLHNSTYRDFPQSFMTLENTLRKDLSHNWTVDEMAAMVGLGTTAFTEKVKSFSGFSPLNYLITIRISEAIRLLKQRDFNVTDIALDTGFYSSQHFSTTFKKLTGYTPSEFRKKHTSNE